MARKTAVPEVCGLRSARTTPSRPPAPAPPRATRTPSPVPEQRDRRRQFGADLVGGDRGSTENREHGRQRELRARTGRPPAPRIANQLFDDLGGLLPDRLRDGQPENDDGRRRRPAPRPRRA